MSRQPRFEIVTSAADQHHARFRAANGAIVWTTETYKRRGKAENAIECIAGQFIGNSPRRTKAVIVSGRALEVRYVDERLRKSARPALPDLP